MQSSNKPQSKKVKLNLTIITVLTLFGAALLPFLFSRPKKTPQQSEIAQLNQTISEFTREIHDTKLLIERISKIQIKQMDTTNTKEEEGTKLRFGQKLYTFKYHKPFEVQQIIFGLIGFILVIAGLIFTGTQIGANADNLNVTTNQNIMSHTLDVDKLFIDSPELRRYFSDNQEISPSDKNYNKAKAVADYQLDFFDAFLSQTYYSKLLKDDPEAQQSWDNYMNSSFLQSPIMCQELKAASEVGSYKVEFVDRFKKYCGNVFGT